MKPSDKEVSSNGHASGRVVVVGSANMDMVVRCERFPRPGETVLGNAFNMFPGGKGANQAVAAAKLGADVRFIGKMGADMFRTRLLESLVNDGVHVEHILEDPTEPTGIAVISVDGCGENEIVVVSGSNMRLRSEEIEAQRALIRSADVLLIQLEVPLETVEAAARIGREEGCTVVLNPAPASDISDALLAEIDFLTPNETEATVLSGVEVIDVGSAELAGERLRERGAKAVVITLGATGALLVDDSGSRLFPAFPADVVDTTGAGDAFNGGLAYALAEGSPVAEAVTLGNRVAAYSVAHAGAQTSMPTAREVLPDVAPVSRKVGTV
jgi:ribokinase